MGFILTCPWCDGEGVWPAEETCVNCGGDGEIDITDPAIINTTREKQIAIHFQIAHQVLEAHDDIMNKFQDTFEKCTEIKNRCDEILAAIQAL